MDDLELAKRYIGKADSCKARNISFTLSLTSYRNLMRAKYCFYTGILLTEKGITGRTIDRIDNTKGYESGNVVACCAGFNHIKSIWESPEELDFKDVVKGIKKLQKTLPES